MRDEAYRIDCDPKQASESAARVFALNNGLAAFNAKCAGGDKLPQEAKTEQLLQFGRKCLQDSGLVSADAGTLGGALSTIDMNRDDKAHRFVVTWNAFLDGNRLAYLSLILAIAVDGLVFMSGLFGAQAMRSPLTDMDGRQSLTAEQLEKLIDGALRTTSDPFATIRAINALSRPVSDRSGFASQIDFEETHAYAGDIKIVLLAASTIDGIAPVGPNSYLVKKGLAAYFNTAAEKFGKNASTTVDRNEIQEMLESALEPDIPANAALVLGYMHAIDARDGFVAELKLADVQDQQDRAIVRNVLNAGVALGIAMPDRPQPAAGGMVFGRQKAIAIPDRGAQAYDVHVDLFKTLLRLKASRPAMEAAARAALQGGNLSARQPAIGSEFGGQRLLPNVLNEMAKSRDIATMAANAPSGKPKPPPLPAGGILQPELLRDFFVGCMVAALGVEPQSYGQITGETYAAALAASEAFKSVQRANKALDRLIAERERDAQAIVDQVFDRLVATPEGRAPGGAQALNDAYGDVVNNITIIALLPGGGIERLMGQITAELEPAAGAGTLSPDERELHRLVRQLMSHLTASHRNGAGDWKQLEAGFIQAHPAAGHFAVVASVGRKQQ